MKRQQVLFLIGPPASGKSSYARELIEGDPSWKRANKDDLRKALNFSKHSKKNEQFVLEIQDDIIYRALGDGFNVIVDNTHLDKNGRHEAHIREIVKSFNSQFSSSTHGVEFRVKLFNAPLQELIARNDKRRKPVPVGTITYMHEYMCEKYPETCQLEEEIDKEKAIIVDLDGTLALHQGRSPYDYAELMSDKLNVPVARVVNGYLNNGYRVIFLSGRENMVVRYSDGEPITVEGLTRSWLNRYGFTVEEYGSLFLRANKDHRKDSIVKNELYERHVKPYYDVELVLDDRDQVVEMWRSEGLTCFQVAPGNF